ncbi:hypothetical protein [Streptomyces sp. NPDC088794]|uniref:hypothetical protein n=1 Tax=Streptomyces sp. NPDC088794 TaxID=3365902 RepID=UPI0037FDB6BB
MPKVEHQGSTVLSDDELRTPAAHLNRVIGAGDRRAGSTRQTADARTPGSLRPGDKGVRKRCVLVSTA